MATRFRDLMRPTLIDVGARSTKSGGAVAANSLADALGSFSRVSGSIGKDLNTKRGEKEGAAAGAEGAPEFKSGLRGLGAYAEAYNNSALRSYSIRMETDMHETAARLEAEAALNPETFRDSMDAVKKGVLSEAPVEAQPIIGQIYEQRAAEGLARIQTKLAADIREQDGILVAEQTAQYQERIAALRAQDTPEAAARAEEEELKLGMLIESAVRDGTFSEAEGAVVQRQAVRGVIAETVKARFAKEMEDPFGDPIGFIEDVIELSGGDAEQILTPEEEEDLQNELFGMLRDRNSLSAAREKQEEEAIEARFVAGDTALTIDVIDGTATTQDLIEAMADERLKPARGLTLSNAMDSRKDMPAKSDPQTLAEVEVNVLSYEEDDIWGLPGLSWSDRGDLIKARRIICCFVDKSVVFVGVQTQFGLKRLFVR